MPAIQSLESYIRARYTLPAQGDFVIRRFENKHWSQAKMAQLRDPEECRELWEAEAMRTASHPNFQFIGFTFDRVQEFSYCLGVLKEMVAKGLSQVGLFTYPGDTTFEKFFGTRPWHGRSATVRAGGPNALSGFQSRAQYVRQMLTEMQANLAKTWIIFNDGTPNIAASLAYEGSFRIEIGKAFPKGLPKHYHAGILIHEMGHNVGLSDVCSLCHEAQLSNCAHFIAHGHLECKAGENARHGNLASQGRGHFIGSDRVKLLAKSYENMAVFNTDSYRCYCSSFWAKEANEQWALHQKLEMAG